VPCRPPSEGSRDLLAATPDEARVVDLQLWGRLCMLRPEPDGGFLPIPGQLSPKEGRMLYHLLAEVWDGEGDVVELGTLFGASTQAIGLGMAANPARRGRLLSVDAFGLYLPGDEMASQLEPLLGGREDWPAIAADLRESGFQRAFTALHGSGRPYSDFLTVVPCLIPRGPDDAPDALNGLLEEAAPIGVAFVDSVKHWFAVRTVILALLPRLAEGALLACQDQRWFSAQAIAFLNERLGAWLEPLAIGDGMHVYRVRAVPAAAELEPLLPASAAGAGAAELERVFEELAWRSYLANDAYGVLSATLQLAFALAEVGERARALAVFEGARDLPGFRRHEDLLRLAGSELDA
jgi:Methyltransferase domain